MFDLKIEAKKLINLLKFNLKDEKKIDLIANKIKEFSKKKNSKFLVCGNGGSATDSEHFVTELVVRFKKKRKSLPAINLSSNPGLITACANDFKFSYIFKRQLESLATELESLGHPIKIQNKRSGLHIALKKNNGYIGSADPRREGLVIPIN